MLISKCQQHTKLNIIRAKHLHVSIVSVVEPQRAANRSVDAQSSSHISLMEAFIPVNAHILIMRGTEVLT